MNVESNRDRQFAYIVWKETPMLTPFGYFDLVEGMTQSGCPICNLLVRNTQKMLDTMLYEYVTEPEMHQMFRASRGLCNVHGWQLTEQGNVMSIAVLYHAVVDEILKELANEKPQRKRVRQLFNKKENSALVGSVTHKVPCPVCQKNIDYEDRYVVVFSDHLADEKLVSAYQESDGLCLEHFKQVLNRTANRENTQILVAMQRAIWNRLKHDLSEFVRKYDYNNAHEAMGAEGDSWLRAIRQMSGEKGVFGLRSHSIKS